MSQLPSPETPLYHHPLPALEGWLRQLGAVQERADPCLWDLQRPEWSARIQLQVEEIKVSWHADGKACERHFPYGLSRADTEAAILAGP